MVENGPKPAKIVDILTNSHIKEKAPIKDVVVDPTKIERALLT